MEILNFLYNIILLLLYSIPLTLGFVLYMQNKKRIYLYTCILFLSFIVDNIIIYMAENILWFSRLYNRLLLSVPTVKTLLYLITLGSTLLIITEIFQRSMSTFFWISLILIMLFQLYTPILSDGPWKVWIYYFPAQLFMFCLGTYNMYMYKKAPGSNPPTLDGHFYKVMAFYAVMAAAITLEDSIVIFHFDNYPPLEIEIQNRSFTQDFMNIGLSLYAIKLLFDKLSRTIVIPDTKQDISSIQIPDMDFSTAPDVPEIETKIPSKAYLFSKEYQLTAREQEIPLLLLDNKSNQEISDELKISIGTTKTHTHNIFQKFGVRKRQQLLEAYQNYNLK